MRLVPALSWVLHVDRLCYALKDLVFDSFSDLSWLGCLLRGISDKCRSRERDAYMEHTGP